MSKTHNTNNTMYKTMNKTEHYTRKARKYAIMAISGLLENTRDFPNKKFNTKILGYDLYRYH